MNRVVLKNVLPTPIQELLVQALLVADKEFLAQWEAWKKVAGPYGDLDDGSLRLFPLVYRRLKQLLPNDSWLTVCANAYKTSWLKNSLLWQEAGKVADLFLDHNIPFLIVKGAAFVSLYYGRDVGVRSLDDVDFWIPVDHFFAALQLLATHQPSYRSYSDVRYFQPDFFHEMTYVTERGILDMHCHLLHTYLRPGDWQIFFAEQQSIKIVDRQVITLSDSDHILHICAHALQWNPEDGVQLRWIIDVARIVRTGRVDWQRVLAVAKTTHVALPVSAALRYVREQFFIEVPEDVLVELEKIPVRLADKRMFYLEMQNTYTRILPAVEMYWWRYVKSLSRPLRWRQMKEQLRRFLLFLCQTDDGWQVPGMVLWRFGELMIRGARQLLGINFLF